MEVASGIEVLEINGVIFGQPYQLHPTLIMDADTALLVDAGFPGDHIKIRAAIERVGLPFGNLKKVILTHQDADHLGGLSGILKELHNQVEVLAHEEEKAYIQGDRRPLKLAQLEDHPEEMTEEMRVFYDRLKILYHDRYVHVDRTLTDGEELPYLGGVVVIHTPGHTLGHICLYAERSKVLIAGDELEVNNGVLVAASPTLIYDRDLYKQSLKKLTRYDIETVICYHGGIYRERSSRRIGDLASTLQ